MAKEIFNRTPTPPPPPPQALPPTDNPQKVFRGSPQSGQGNTVGGIDLFKQKLSDLPYYNTPAFQSLIQGFAGHGGAVDFFNKNPQGTDQWKSVIQGYGDTFASQFQNLAGRPPTNDEYNTFFSQVINPSTPWLKAPDQAAVQQGAQGLLKDTFSSTIADAQTKKAQAQADAATAEGSPFDAWSKSMSTSVDNLDKQLQDYQSRLFEKIRPQLLTSLQSQGLLNSGALNEAFAGAASDLTNAESGYVANARLNADQNVANTKYAIRSSPGNNALQTTFNTLPDLTQSGQNALQNAFSNYMNTSLANINYNNTRGLMDYQNQNQPSLLSQYGGQILGGAAAGAASRWSDARLKENVKDSDPALDKVIQMDVVDFNYLPEVKLGNEVQTGLIAQDLKKVVPNAVIEDKSGYLKVDYSVLVPLLIKSIQELNDKLKDLEFNAELKYGT